jgi:SSS family solute:Na+ symporter
VAKDRDPEFYLRAGRWVTVAGILVSVLTAFIAKGYSNIMNYIQTLFSIFNAPLFATFIIAMFWKRATAWGGFWSLVAGTAAAYATNRLAAYHTIFHFSSPLSSSFWQAIMAFVVDGVVIIVVSLVTQPKATEDLRGLVWGLTRDEAEEDEDPRDKLWWRSPWLLGGVTIAVIIALNIIFI